MDGVLVSALVDTGANLSLVSQVVVEKIQQRGGQLRKAPLHQGLRIVDAQKKPLEIMGKFIIDLKGQDGLQVSFPFYAVNRLDAEAILGWNLQKEVGIMTNAADETVRITLPNGRSSSRCQSLATSQFLDLSRQPEHWVAEVRPTKRQLIPARQSMVIECVARTGLLRVQPGATVMVQQDGLGEFGVREALATVHDDNKVRIVVDNFGHYDRVIHPDEALQQASIRSTDDCDIFEATAKTMAAVEQTIKPLGKEMSEYLLTNLDLDTVSDDFKILYKTWALKNHDIFAESKYDVGFSDTVSHEIRMKDNNPVYVQQFKIPHAHEQAVNELVDKYMAQGVIKECASPYNSPLFCVAKPGGGLRVVQDFRSTNEHSLDDKFAIRDVRECIDHVGRSKSTVFSTLDLAAGFHQQQLQEQSQVVTAFTLPHRNTQYCWTRNCMGLKGAPASFSRLMGVVFKGQRGILTYVDDGLIHAKDHVEQLQILDEVAQRLRNHGLKLNVKKCFLGRASVAYLGYRISADGVSPSRDKLKAIKNMAAPRSVRQVKEFVGLSNYFRHMVPAFAKLATPLTNLTRKNCGWDGGQLPAAAMEAFNKIRTALCSEPVMAYPDPDLPYTIAVDAAVGDAEQDGGLGGILSQKSESGLEKVVAYWSRPLKHHEKSYSAYGLEMRAAVDALEHFHEYVFGKPVTILTDHKPIVGASKVHQKTLNRLAELMNVYDVKIIYRPGKENGGPDCLSRNAVSMTTSGRNKGLQEKQEKDVLCMAVAKFLASQQLPGEDKLRATVATFGPRCFKADNVLWFTEKRRGKAPRTMFLTPNSMKMEVLGNAHGGTSMVGHWGMDRTLERCLNNYFWPSIAQDVARFVEACPVCQERRDGKARGQRMPLRPWQPATESNMRVHIDLWGPVRSSTANKYVMVITDAYSKLVELVPLPSKEAKVVAAKIFEQWICRRGVMKQLATDQGREFANNTLKELCMLMDAKKTLNSSLHPQASGSVERFNSEMRAYLQVMVDTDTLNWEEYLAPLMMAHNSAVNRSTMHSPHYLTYLTEPRLPGTLDKPSITAPQSTASDMFKRLQETRKMVVQNNEEARAKYTEYFNRKATAKAFEVGDEVLVHYPSPPPGLNPKLYRPWHAGYRISKILDMDNVILQRMQDGKMLQVHYNRVKLLNKMQAQQPCQFEDKPAKTADEVVQKSPKDGDAGQGKKGKRRRQLPVSQKQQQQQRPTLQPQVLSNSPASQNQDDWDAICDILELEGLVGGLGAGQPNLEQPAVQPIGQPAVQPAADHHARQQRAGRGRRSRSCEPTSMVTRSKAAAAANEVPVPPRDESAGPVRGARGGRPTTRSTSSTADAMDIIAFTFRPPKPPGKHGAPGAANSAGQTRGRPTKISRKGSPASGSARGGSQTGGAGPRGGAALRGRGQQPRHSGPTAGSHATDSAVPTKPMDPRGPDEDVRNPHPHADR